MIVESLADVDVLNEPFQVIQQQNAHWAFLAVLENLNQLVHFIMVHITHQVLRCYHFYEGVLGFYGRLAADCCFTSPLGPHQQHRHCFVLDIGHLAENLLQLGHYLVVLGNVQDGLIPVLLQSVLVNSVFRLYFLQGLHEILHPYLHQFLDFKVFLKVHHVQLGVQGKAVRGLDQGLQLCPTKVLRILGDVFHVNILAQQIVVSNLLSMDF